MSLKEDTMGAFNKYRNLEYRLREASDQFTHNGAGLEGQPFISIGNPYWVIKRDEYESHTFRVCKVDECVAFLIELEDGGDCGGVPHVVFRIPSFGVFSLDLSDDYDKLFVDNLDDKLRNQTHYVGCWEFGHAAMNFVKYLENNYRVRRNYFGT